MIALIQRVTEASVTIDNVCHASIGNGMLVLVAIEPDDTEARLRIMTERLLNYRIFADETGRMNRSLRDSNGDILVVSQFTLAADTKKGLRPGFSTAADPEDARLLFEYLIRQIKTRYGRVATGIFGADMQIGLINDGPATFILKG